MFDFHVNTILISVLSFLGLCHAMAMPVVRTPQLELANRIVDCMHCEPHRCSSEALDRVCLWLSRYVHGDEKKQVSTTCNAAWGHVRGMQ